MTGLPAAPKGTAPVAAQAGFGYHRPKSLADALRLGGEIPGARFVAGGTDLLVQVRKRPLHERPPALVSLRGIRELSGIRREGGSLRIGALTSIADLAESPEVRGAFPALVEAALAMGSVQIRNVATVGGNLANASPAADLAPPLLVHEARVEVSGPGASREIPLEAFFQGPGKTVLAPQELLAAVWLTIPAPGTRTAFLRRGRVRMDLAVASLAFAAHASGGVLAGVRIAAGAVAPVPLRLRKAEAVLEGRRPAPALVEQAKDAARSEISPITDLRGAREYRRDLVGVFLARALERAAEEAGGEEI